MAATITYWHSKGSRCVSFYGYLMLRKPPKPIPASLPGSPREDNEKCCAHIAQDVAGVDNGDARHKTMIYKISLPAFNFTS